MLEIEMKFPVTDFKAIKKQLKQLQAKRHEFRTEVDSYFNAPDRDFAATDEALRIRRIGKKNKVTYKGPKVDSQTKTRTELEVALAKGHEVAEQFQQLLRHLQYRFVAEVHKQRTIYTLHREGFSLAICLDDVAEVGCFVEVEITADTKQFKAARAVVLRVAKDLGLDESERRSYLEMLLTREVETGKG